MHTTLMGRTDFTSTIANVVGMAEENDENDDNGTVVINGIQGELSTTLVIRNVMLDVSETSGPVTVTAEIESSEVHRFLAVRRSQRRHGDQRSSSSEWKPRLTRESFEPEAQVLGERRPR